MTAQLPWHRAAYADRKARGVCTRCEGTLAPGDAILCQECRRVHRTTNTDYQRGRYAQRVVDGVCVSCGGQRAEGDARRCSRCRARLRAYNREEQRAATGVPRGHRHERTVADVGATARPLVVCRTCCDLPWRRPVTGCPCCGGAHAREDTRDAAELCSRRESVGPWE